jgi:hypothetical protein
MATYFVGTGIESFVISPTLVTDLGGGGINIGGPIQVGYADAYLVDPVSGLRAPQTAMWLHFAWYNWANVGSNADVFTVNRTDGTPVFRFMLPSIWMIAAEYWDGAKWVRLGDPMWTQNTYTYDIRLVSHPTAGRIAVNINGTNWFDVKNIDTSSLGAMEKVRFKEPQGVDGANARFYDVIIASYNTIGHTVRRRFANADAQTGWTGGYDAIDEDTTNDTDAISTSESGKTATFNAANLSPTAPGNVIKAVAVGARIRNDGGASPANAKVVLTVNGTDYTKPNNLVVGSGYNGALQVFDKNPATGKAWASIDEVNQPFGLLSTE